MSNKIRKYQEEKINLCNKTDKGKIILPTGTGKTFIQQKIIHDDIIKNKGEFKIYMIVDPKIILTIQMLEEYFKYFTVQEKVKVRYLGINSTNKDYSDEFKKLLSEEERVLFTTYQNKIMFSTKYDDIKKEIELSIKQNCPLLVFSTYKSFDSLQANINEYNKRNNTNINIEILILDEAHHLVRKENYKKLQIIDTNKSYYFTATNIDDKNGIKMSDKAIFGEVLGEWYSPEYMINNGYMIKPKLHIIDNFYNEEDANLINTLINAFEKHEKIINRSGKLLITTDGGEMMKAIKDSLSIFLDKDINIYYISSSDNTDIEGIEINGNKKTRMEFFTTLREDCKDENKRMLLVHNDILTEGIDIPQLTGNILCKGLNKTKLIQTLGRSARPHINDKEDISDKNPYEDENILKNMTKPYFYIIVPDIRDKNFEIEADTIINLTEQLIDEYDFNPNEDIISDNTNNLKKEDILESLVHLDKNSFKYKIIEKIKLRHEIRELKNKKSLIHNEYYNNEQKLIKKWHNNINNLQDEEFKEIPTLLLDEIFNKYVGLKNNIIDKKNDKVCIFYNIEVYFYLIKKGYNKDNIYIRTENLNRINILEKLNIKHLDIKHLDIKQFKNKDDMKFDLIIGNPPYNNPINTGMKKRRNIQFYLDFVDESLLLSKNKVIMIGPYSYLSDKNSLKSRNIIDLVKTDKFGNQCAIPVCYTFHDKNINKHYINPYINYPKYKKEFSIASLFSRDAPSGDFVKNRVYLNINDKKQNVDDIKIYTSTQTIKYIPKNLEKDFIDVDKNYEKYRIIYRVQDTKFSDPQILQPNTLVFPMSLNQLLINNQQEGELIINHIKNNLDIINNIRTSTSLTKDNFQYILLPPPPPTSPTSPTPPSPQCTPSSLTPPLSSFLTEAQQQLLNFYNSPSYNILSDEDKEKVKNMIFEN